MSNEILQAFAFEGNNVTFYEKDGMLYINATEMAKSFGNSKRPQFWLNLQSTREFLSALTEARNLASVDLQRITKGGPNQGTWLRKDVAIEFARWLSPKFAIWCNDRIEELMTKGHTELPTFDIPKTYSEALMLAAKQAQRIEAQDKELSHKQSIIDNQRRNLQNSLRELNEKAAEVAVVKKESDYCKSVLSSESLITTTSVAQDYGMSAKSFNSLLYHLGVQYKCDGQWILTAKYKDKGYVQSETIIIDASDNHRKVVVNTKWTQRGRKFLYELLKKHDIYPVCDPQNKYRDEQ